MVTGPQQSSSQPTTSNPRNIRPEDVDRTTAPEIVPNVTHNSPQPLTTPAGIDEDVRKEMEAKHAQAMRDKEIEHARREEEIEAKHAQAMRDKEAKNGRNLKEKLEEEIHQKLTEATEELYRSLEKGR